MSGVLDAIRDFVRSIMRAVAGGLHHGSNGKITPNMVTLASLFAHLPIAYFIATGSFLIAAILLIIFGLFDALDGELARLQKKAGPAGMVLDASTDRMKEVILYMGVVYALIDQPNSDTAPAVVATIAVAACGASLLVSYIKAKGETAVKDSSLSANQINRLFQDGLLRFELRMAILIVGLLTTQLLIAISIVAALAWLTAFDRLWKIYRKLS